MVVPSLLIKYRQELRNSLFRLLPLFPHILAVPTHTRPPLSSRPTPLIVIEYQLTDSCDAALDLLTSLDRRPLFDYCNALFYATLDILLPVGY